jgi:hypothetical protein
MLNYKALRCPVLTFVDTNVLLYAHDGKPDDRCELTN